MRKFSIMAGAALVAALGACNGERTAESETPVSEAEVSTELPESVVSDQALEATANAAADVAASPPPAVVVVPGQPATAPGGASATMNTQATNQQAPAPAQ